MIYETETTKVNAFLRDKHANDEWTHVEVQIPQGVDAIYIRGTVGSIPLEPTKNYIAVDDVKLSNVPCQNPGWFNFY